MTLSEYPWHPFPSPIVNLSFLLKLHDPLFPVTPLSHTCVLSLLLFLPTRSLVHRELDCNACRRKVGSKLSHLISSRQSLRQYVLSPFSSPPSVSVSHFHSSHITLFESHCWCHHVRYLPLQLAEQSGADEMWVTCMNSSIAWLNSKLSPSSSIPPWRSSSSAYTQMN